MHAKDLPDKQRQVIAYHYLAGLRYADIAEILAEPPTRRAGPLSTASPPCADASRRPPEGDTR